MDMKVSTGASAATPQERGILRELASRVMELASSPGMQEKKEAWKASNDLNPKRPVILFETIAVDGFKDEKALQCTDPYLRDVEKALREMIRHCTEVDDDYVVESYYRIPWKVKSSGIGVDIGEQHATDMQGKNIAYRFENPIKHVSDIEKLKPARFTVFREDTQKLADKVQDAIGDILPVRIGGLDFMFTEWEGIFSLTSDAVNPDGSRRYLGYTPCIGDYFFGICMTIFKLLGNENLIYWCYEHPEAIHAIADFVSSDRINFFNWCEEEGLLDSNADNEIVGSGPLGYVSCLPKPEKDNRPQKISGIWGWAEAQEAEIFSPQMFREFFLPYIARVSNKFGLISYGCCEKLTDRMDTILQAIPNIRSVAVSPWNDDAKMAEILGNKYTYCKKVMPSYLTAETVDWDIVEKEIKGIYSATKGCNLQLVVRDVYSVNGDFKRLADWAKLSRKILGI